MALVKPGDLVAVGRTSEVYEYGRDSVIKIPGPEVPAHWATNEAQFTRAVRTCGVPAPEVRDVVTIDERPAIVFERVDGPSMWQEMLAAPDDVDSFTAELATVHREIQQAGLPPGLPDLVERMCLKIDDVRSLDTGEKAEARALARSLPRGAALLHGDLHPGNVLMSPSGPVVIDWFDATIGHPVADIVRSSILLRPHIDGVTLPHLPDASPAFLDQVRRSYMSHFGELLEDTATLAQWEAVVAVSRIAERSDHDDAGLLDYWNARTELTG